MPTDTVLEEICRVKEPADIQGHSLRRWQAYLRDVIQPKLRRLADLEASDAERQAAVRRRPTV